MFAAINLHWRALQAALRRLTLVETGSEAEMASQLP